MSTFSEVPSDDRLQELSVEVSRHDEPWIATIRSVAKDESVLQITWDEVAGSVTVWVLRGEIELVRIEREMVDTIRMYERESNTYLEVVAVAPDTRLVLQATVADSVSISDTLLRTE